MSVQQTTEVVVLVAVALTPRAASRVPVNLDTPMTEPAAKASQLNVYAVYIDMQKAEPYFFEYSSNECSQILILMFFFCVAFYVLCVFVYFFVFPTALWPSGPSVVDFK